MSLSGVLLNHPDMLRGLSAPSFLVPDHYYPDNWNRSSMKGMLCTDSSSFFIYGNQGVFISPDKGKTIRSFMQGEFPKSPWEKRTNHLIFLNKTNQLLAATNKGFYICVRPLDVWESVVLPGNAEPVQKILFQGDTCIAVTNSEFYIAKDGDYGSFVKFIPQKAEEEPEIPMFRVFLEIHDGSIWGLPGKLLWDFVGLTLFFLCFSAFYIWYYPKKWKRKYTQKQTQSSTTEKKLRSFYFKYHKKLGWYASAFYIVIIFTGIFLRPPLLVAIAGIKIDKKYFPATEHINPWNHKINNALYDSQNGQIVLECSDGLWAGQLTPEKPFKKLSLPIRVFAMGATVFEEVSKGTWLIGSFGGLEMFSLSDSSSISVLQQPPSNNPVRPGSLLVTGYVRLPENKEYILGHYQGLSDTNGNPVPEEIPMPDEIKQQYKMPFWNFLFELHNGRIFKGVIGGFYILIIPLFGFFSLLIILSGIYDYCHVKFRLNQRFLV
jgi:hypothetical protein